MKKQRIPRKLKKKIKNQMSVRYITTQRKIFELNTKIDFKGSQEMYEGKKTNLYLMDEMALWQH